MKNLCIFMVCLSVSFSCVILSIATFEHITSEAYSIRVDADWKLMIMAFNGKEKHNDA